MSVVLLVVVSLLLGSNVTAWAYWTASSLPGGNGAATATSVAQGKTPTASSARQAVTVTWAASNLGSGQPVNDYEVKRYDATTLVLQATLAGCLGTISATTCTENNVPEGSWVYSITPKYATNWVGAESAKSSAVAVVAPPTVTINQAAGQVDPTAASPVNYTVVFSKSVTGFATGDVTVGGTAGGTKTATVTGSGTTYNVAVTGMTSNGTIIATIAAAVSTDTAGNNNTASTSTDNTVTRDTTRPKVTINQAAGQPDPTSASPIRYTVVFDEPVTGFATGDVTVGGTAGGTKTATVTGSGTTYNVAVTGMTTNGSIVTTIAANTATDAAGNTNTASTSTDNTVTWVRPP